MHRLPGWVQTPLVGGLAMLASNGLAVKLGKTDPKEWPISGWFADIVPHLAYGIVAVRTFHAIWRCAEDCQSLDQ